jgi:hypothetical protein
VYTPLGFGSTEITFADEEEELLDADGPDVPPGALDPSSLSAFLLKEPPPWLLLLLFFAAERPHGFPPVPDWPELLFWIPPDDGCRAGGAGGAAPCVPDDDDDDDGALV